MFRLKLLWFVSAKLMLFLILFNVFLCSQGNARHYLIENTDEAKSKTNFENLNYKQEYHECYITVQETKRVGGQCVKIRENFHGCIAGNLIDPFHQDCL